MAIDLNPRKREILRLMGIDLWSLRESAPEAEAIAPASDQAVPDQERQPPLESKAPMGMATGKASVEPPNLDSIRSVVSSCSRCGLDKTRTNTVFGSGDANADWLFIGEAPGHNEDQQGLPFVGRAGQLLTKMIAALDQTRDEVYIANVLKCRPPNNRDPLPEEVDHCEPYLHQQIELISPKVIVALGRISAQALLKSSHPLGRMRGKVYQYGPQNTPLVVTYHPAYLLRNPIDKRKTWADLLLAQSVVQQA